MLHHLHRSKGARHVWLKSNPLLIRTEMRRACMTPSERKTDTRRKIQFGGLIIKAGLASEEPAVLLGMLTAGARVLNTPNALESRRRWKELGNRAFGSATKH